MKLSIAFVVLSLQLSLAQEVQKTWMAWVSKGTALVDAGNYAAAAQAFRQALTEAERSGVESRSLVKIMGCLASAYADTGQYSEAEREWRQALPLVEKTEGSESLDYALLLASVAVLPTHSGTSEQTVATIRKAISINRQSNSYRDLAVTRRCLAEILIERKRYGEAEELLLDAQADFARLETPDHARVAAALNCLGLLRFRQGRFAESLAPFRRSLTELEYKAGAEHPVLIPSLNNLASSLVKLGRMEEAASVYQRAVAICSKTLGDHAICGTVFGNYALILRKLGRKREAKEMAARARQIELASRRRNGVGSVVSLESLRSGAN